MIKDSANQDYAATKTPNPTQVEELKEKNQQIPEKNHQIQEAKNPSAQPFDFLKGSEEDHFSLKKILKLPSPFEQAKVMCYIPEKNLLIIVVQDHITVKMYNTITFGLVNVKKASGKIVCMSYSQELGGIIVGGQNGFLQLWNPNSFKVEAECLKTESFWTIRTIAYIPKSNIIVAKTDSQVRVYNTELTYLKCIEINLYLVQHCPADAEILSLSQDLFLTFGLRGYQKVPVLVNLKAGGYKEFSNEVYIPLTSCIETTENAPENVITCLGMFNSEPLRPHDERNIYQLIQFTINTKMKEPVLLRSSNISTHSFRRLSRVENSKCLLAERFAKAVFQICLLSVDKNQVEILRVVSTPSPMILNQVHPYIMTKDGLSLVEFDSNYQVAVHRSVVKRERFDDELED